MVSLLSWSFFMCSGFPPPPTQQTFQGHSGIGHSAIIPNRAALYTECSSAANNRALPIHPPQ